MTSERAMTIVQAIEQGFRFHQAGQLEQAEHIYRRVLQQDPNNPHVLNFLGIIAYQTRRYEEAERLARQAVRGNTNIANFHNTLGLAVQERGRLDEAEACFRQALLLEPNFVEAQSNLGNVLRLRKKLADAVRAYQLAISLQPNFADAQSGLGRVYAEENKYAEARSCFERAIVLDAKHADARNSLGLLLHREGKFDDAEALFKFAIELKPDFVEAYNNLGNTLRSQGKFDAAVACYRHALTLNPDRSEVYFNLANILDETGQLDEAIALYKKALAVDPNSIPVYRHLGAALEAQGKPEEALTIYRRALSVTSDDGLKMQLATVLPVIPTSIEDMYRWRKHMEIEITRLPNAPLRLREPMEEIVGTNFLLTYHGLNNRELHIKIAELYKKACPSLTWTAPHCTDSRRSSRKIRIGFISRFMHNHSIGKITRGILGNLARDQFETFSLFVPPLQEDEISRFIRTHSHQSVVLPETLDSARRLIADLKLDILFYQDIGMERFTYFLAFSRLAPVQCVSFGHPDTTGIPNMDYFVSNDLFEPSGAQQHYSEKLFLLHDLGTLSYYYRPPLPDVMKRREDFGLPADANLYICPQALFKFHPEFDTILAGILRGDPRGRLVLLAGKIPHCVKLLRARFTAAFPDAADRVIFLPSQTNTDFTSLIAISDVMLDTIHFVGMTTSLEAFSVGTPVVTMPTALQRGRHTTGMYTKMGLTEGIAHAPEQYVEIALRLGTDTDRRRQFKNAILQRNHVLFEDMRAVREFERFFLEAVAHAHR